MYEGISRDDDYPTVVKKTFETTINALKDTLEIMEEDVYEEACKPC